MIRLLTAVLFLASFDAVAEVSLTDINNNEVADADEVMGNFNALKDGVEANATAIQNLDSSGGVTASQLRALITVVEETESCQGGENQFVLGCYAACPDDKIAIGGGCFLVEEESFSGQPLWIRHGIFDNYIPPGGFGPGAPELIGKAYDCMTPIANVIRKVQAVCL